MTVSDLRQFLNIHYVACRVSDGFAEHRTGALINSGLKTIKVVVRHHARFNALTRQCMSEQIERTAVQLAGADDIVAGFTDALQGIGNGSHS